MDAVFTAADDAERGETGPREALTKLRSTRTQPPSFGPAVIVGGHAVIAVGLAVILSGGWTELGVAAALGAVVGMIKHWSERGNTTIQVFLPVSCAMLVSAAVALLARTPLDPSILPPILGALVTFIPGGLLTTAVIELATGQMISGASRFLFGVPAARLPHCDRDRPRPVPRHRELSLVSSEQVGPSVLTVLTPDPIARPVLG